MPGCLYVVGTPIGNLGDMSPRAIDILRTCDFIAAEDTRVTLKLLNHFDIKKYMISYYEHNKAQKGEIICQRILSGESCALVTDAGMPAISDPGQELVNRCHELNIKVIAVPGPTAFATAVAVSGLCTSRFTFEGFLSTAKKSRREHLDDIKHEKRTMVFYEAPHKLCSTLEDMLETLGNRNIVIVRELTKIHEEIIRTTFNGALEMYKETSPKGEFVLIIEGVKDTDEQTEMTIDQAVLYARQLMDNGQSASNAAKEAANISGYKKSEIYKLLINMGDK